MKDICPDCGGQGVEIEPECCGKRLASGECCGNPEPRCCGMGQIEIANKKLED